MFFGTKKSRFLYVDLDRSETGEKFQVDVVRMQAGMEMGGIKANVVCGD